MRSPAPLSFRSQAGQSSVEYLVACAVVWALIAVPIAGSDSALDLMLDAIETCYDRFSSAISLPL